VSGYCPTSTPPVGELLARTGASYRALDYWTRAGYLHPENDGLGSGKPRTWPDEEIRVARVMAELVAAGVSVQSAHHAARNDGALPGSSLRIVRLDPDTEVTP